MFDLNEIKEVLRNILAGLDSYAYPQLYGYLSDFLNSEDPEDGPYGMATRIMQMDRPQALPHDVIEFVKDLYDMEIERHNPDAMNDVGAMYYDGSRGFEQDFSKAVAYYEMAAKYGSRQAQENLGYCYYYGRNVEVDYRKAFHYFALGAFDGHLISLYKIGDMYRRGYYVEKNPHEAFLIYMQCLNMMTQEAEKFVAGPVYLRLGDMFLNGEGTDMNAKNALISYQRAESFLYDMVKEGSDMYRRSLQAAIDGQKKARKILADELHENTWPYSE